jgi:hypothetical protein
LAARRWVEKIDACTFKNMDLDLSDDFGSPNHLGDDLYLSVGSRVVDLWESIGAEASPPSIGARIKRLEEIISLPLDALPDAWEDEVTEIVDKMTPSEFAVHGAKLIQFFLQLNEPPVALPPPVSAGCHADRAYRTGSRHSAAPPE